MLTALLRVALVSGLTLASGAAFGREDCDWPVPVSTPGPAQPAPSSFPDVSAPGTGTELIFLGDSLTAGTGSSSREHSLPGLTAGELGRPYRVMAMGGQTSTWLKDEFVKQDLPADAVAVVWVGRINFTDTAGVENDLAEIANHLGNRRFLVLTVIAKATADEDPGTPQGASLAALNAMIRDKYPDNYVEVGVDLGCADHTDPVHLNDAGYKKIAKPVLAAIARHNM